MALSMGAAFERTYIALFTHITDLQHRKQFCGHEEGYWERCRAVFLLISHACGETEFAMIGGNFCW